jgi:hypothetical protein
MTGVVTAGLVIVTDGFTVGIEGLTVGIDGLTVGIEGLTTGMLTVGTATAAFTLWGARSAATATAPRAATICFWMLMFVVPL